MTGTTGAASVARVLVPAVCFGSHEPVPRGRARRVPAIDPFTGRPMFGGHGKRLYVRTRISRLEQGFSWAILGVLAGLGTAVYWSGQNGAPMVASIPGPAPVPTSAVAAPTVILSPAASRTTAAAPTIPPAATVVRSGEDLLAGLAAPGWQAAAPPQHFTTANLYEKIDGRAEQYLAFEVQALFCQQLSGPGGAAIEIFAYDMGDPLRAFGVFTAERAPEHAPEKLGHDGYMAGGSYLFWQDRWYLQLLASDQTAPVQRTALEMARSLSARLGNEGSDLWGLALLPQTGRIPRTEQYLLRDALGLEFLTNTFAARYRVAESGPELTAFVSRQPTGEAAAGVLASYQAYLREYGSGASACTVAGIKVTLGDLGGTYDLVFQSGKFVAGVSMAPDQAAAERLAADLAQRLAGR